MYFEQQSTKVIMYSILRSVERGPIMSTDKMSHGPIDIIVPSVFRVAL